MKLIRDLLQLLLLFSSLISLLIHFLNCIYVNKLMPHLILLNKDIFNRIGLKFKLAIKAH